MQDWGFAEKLCRKIAEHLVKVILKDRGGSDRSLMLWKKLDALVACFDHLLENAIGTSWSCWHSEESLCQSRLIQTLRLFSVKSWCDILDSHSNEVLLCIDGIVLLWRQWCTNVFKYAHHWFELDSGIVKCWREFRTMEVVQNIKYYARFKVKSSVVFWTL